MSNITINDLELSKELDRAALRNLTGGHGAWGYEYGYSYGYFFGPQGYQEHFNAWGYGYGYGHRGGIRYMPMRRRRRRRRRRRMLEKKVA